MKTSHDIARELLALPPKALLMNGSGSDEGFTLVADRVTNDGYYDAYWLAPSERGDPYAHSVPLVQSTVRPI